MGMLEELIRAVEARVGVRWWLVLCRQEDGFWVRAEVRGVLIRARGSTLERAERRAVERIEQIGARAAARGRASAGGEGDPRSDASGSPDGLSVLLDAGIDKVRRDRGLPRLRVVGPPAPANDDGQE